LPIKYRIKAKKTPQKKDLLSQNTISLADVEPKIHTIDYEPRRKIADDEDSSIEPSSPSKIFNLRHNRNLHPIVKYKHLQNDSESIQKQRDPKMYHN
jgi:hypothetical protein